VTAYLETYTREFGLAPRFGERVVSATRRNGLWHVRTEGSAYLSPFLVVATGVNGEPHVPTWPGQDSFEGQIVHSSQYTTGAGYRGKRVLVVGLGNSGGEIAIDLWESGAIPTLSVRSPVNIIPRDLLGIPILAIAVPLSRLPAWLADALTAPVVRLIFGDQRRLGLRKPPYGPFEQIRRKAKIPLIDVGTIGLVRAGRLDVRPEIAQFTQSGITFTNGRHEDYDAVILATGYRPAHGAFLEEAPAGTNEGKPMRSGREGRSQGLYFCGFYVSPTGMLREIAIEARTIARDIARKRQMANGQVQK
jgi:indole-3-pyruvate monooxygenase